MAYSYKKERPEYNALGDAERFAVKHKEPPVEIEIDFSQMPHDLPMHPALEQFFRDPGPELSDEEFFALVKHDQRIVPKEVNDGIE